MPIRKYVHVTRVYWFITWPCWTNPETYDDVELLVLPRHRNSSSRICQNLKLYIWVVLCHLVIPDLKHSHWASAAIRSKVHQQSCCLRVEMWYCAFRWCWQRHHWHQSFKPRLVRFHQVIKDVSRGGIPMTVLATSSSVTCLIFKMQMTTAELWGPGLLAFTPRRKRRRWNVLCRIRNGYVFH